MLQPNQELFEGVKKPASASTPKESGFEAVFAIAGILAIACAYVALRRNRNR